MTYKIIRFYFSGRKRVVKRGLNLEEAQAHCQNPSSRKPGKWFDGFVGEEKTPPLWEAWKNTQFAKAVKKEAGY